ncbi:MAG: NAD(P)-dependent oxidoreductase [Lachnospiraceae bacterium]|nr:NAD(P)-dependent oxidoreductase [Lachnospiraceae bacterium]
MNVLVNGASGYIGYHLTKNLLENGHRVYAVCRTSEGHLTEFAGNEDLTVIKTEQSVLEEKIKGLNIDVWYQLLWDGALGEKRSDVNLQLTNVKMYLDALNTAEKMGCKKIIYTGTVYEKLSENILKNDAANMHSFYILAKKQAHDLTLQLSKGMKIGYAWVNFCHPMGKYMNPKQVGPYALELFKRKEKGCFGPCRHLFDIIPVSYLADGLRLLGERDTHKKEYYVGSGAPRLLRDILTDMAKECGYDGPIGFDERPDDGLVFEAEWFDTKDFRDDTDLPYRYGISDVVRELPD